MIKKYGQLVFWPAIGFFLLIIPFYRVLLFSDRALFFRDLARDILVQKSQWTESVLAGNGIPFWNHFALGGTPFYSMIVGSPLHPLNTIFLLFGSQESARALSIYIWLHYVLFFAGSYLLLRNIRCRPHVASLMSAMFALSGYMLSVHSLAHLLAASVAVPWFFYFQEKYFQKKKIIFLFAASFFVGWPVYAGDPQFSYMLGAISLFFFVWRGCFRAWFLLCALSLLSSSAQLLPAILDIAKSQRTAMDNNEMLLFSYHPIRLVEMIYPIFFGNRYGGDEYWGGSYVNFNYKHPFIFSIYPGILLLLSMCFFPIFLKKWWRQKKYKYLLLVGAIPLGFIVSFGIFFPIPIYNMLAAVVPLFGLFRYPERFLIWPMFCAWILASLILERILRLPKLPLKKYSLILPLLYLTLTSVLYFGDMYGWIELHPSALISIKKSFLLISGSAIIFVLISQTKNWKKLIPFFFLLMSCADLFFHQRLLIWDQNKHIADPRRYRLVNEIKEDLEKRKEEIKHGGSLRLGTEKLEKFLFYTDLMDHTTSTSFAAFENLVPNVPGLVGIEDISGYYSFLSQRRLNFWDAVVRMNPMGGLSDLRFYFDIMGAYYLPERNQDQEIVLKRNESAQPYLFAPEKIFFRKDSSSALKTLRDTSFRSNRDLILEKNNSSESIEQSGERGNFIIGKRDGKRIEFTYFPQKSTPIKYLTLNESFDENWHAYVNGKRIPVYLANGWSMALGLENVTANEPITIIMRYQNKYILIGAMLSALWLLMGLVLYFRHKKRAAFAAL